MLLMNRLVVGLASALLGAFLMPTPQEAGGPPAAVSHGGGHVRQLRHWNHELTGLRQRVVYARVGKRLMTFYLFSPARAAVSPRPVVIYVHGGALRYGSARITNGNTAHNRLLVRVERRLMSEGIDFISVNYRLAPLHPWPEPLQDVDTAVRFIAAHGERLGIDPERMAIMGDSAGGELSSFVGLTLQNGQSHRPMVQAVVDLFGPTDRECFARQWWRHHGLEPNPVYGIYTPSRIRRESAVSHVHPGAPPFLIIQGAEDTVVPPFQSALLRDRLAESGVPVQEVLVHHAGHELTQVQGVPIAPSLTTLADTINQFVVENLESRADRP